MAFGLDLVHLRPFLHAIPWHKPKISGKCSGDLPKHYPEKRGFFEPEMSQTAPELKKKKTSGNLYGPHFFRGSHAYSLFSAPFLLRCWGNGVHEIVDVTHSIFK